MNNVKDIISNIKKITKYVYTNLNQNIKIMIHVIKTNSSIHITPLIVGLILMTLHIKVFWP